MLDYLMLALIGALAVISLSALIDSLCRCQCERKKLRLEARRINLDGWDDVMEDTYRPRS